jgi:phenylacetate-CoA ligase
MRTTALDGWIARKIGSPVTESGREAMEAYQLRALRRVLLEARESSPFYRRRLADWSPDSLSGLSDLASVPFTTQDDLRENALRFLSLSQGEIARVVTLRTTGTTGNPKRVYFTRDDQELTVDFFRVGMSTLVEAGQKVSILLPGERPGSVGDLLSTALRRLGAEPILQGPVRDVSGVLEEMVARGVDCVVGLPSHLLWLARSSAAASARPSLTSALLTADHVPVAVRRVVESIWGCELFEHYGMTEMGLGGGVECAAHRGYHLREADLYLEIVDPSSGRPLPEGEEGEIVFTTLTRRGMPLIRYRTGDLSRFSRGKCPCGTQLRTLERVSGRVGAGVRLSGGVSCSMAELDEALFPVSGLLGFSASVVHSSARDCLRIEAVAVAGMEGEVRSAVRSALSAAPGLETALATGGLGVSVGVRAGGRSEALEYGKRAIVDARGASAL